MKKISLLILLLGSLLGVNGQTAYPKPDPSLIFAEYFNNAQSVASNGGVGTAMTYRDGKGISTSAGSSWLDYKKPLKGTYSIRIRLVSWSQVGVNQYLYCSATSPVLSFIRINTGTSTIGITTGTVYINGIANTTIASGTNDIVVIGLQANASIFTLFNYATHAIGANLSIDLVEIYDRQLSASEVKNLYENKTNVTPTYGYQLGPELVTNGDFSLWTNPSVPNGWSKVGTHNATNYVQSSNGGCRLISDGTSTGITQAILTAGKKYKLSYQVLSVSGTAKFDYGGATNITTSGNFIVDIIPTSPTLYFYRNSACDATIDNISVREILSEPPLLDFNAWNGVLTEKTGKTLTQSNVSIVQNGSYKAPKFNGTTSYISTTRDGLTGNITICGWFRANGWGEGLAQYGYGRLLDNSKLFILIYQGAGPKCLHFTRDGFIEILSASNSITLGKTYFYAITSTSTGVTNIYLADIKNPPALSGSANQAAGTPASGTTWYIGNRAANDRTFNGVIPMIKIIPKIMSLQEITQEWSATLKYAR